LRLELAADYLVMAAWLAYLKSRLLLPETAPGEGPSAEEMALALAHRLRRLEAFRDVATRLMGRPQLNRDVFARGAPEPIDEIKQPEWTATLYDLLSAYATQRARSALSRMRFKKRTVWSLAEARAALERLIGMSNDWSRIDAFLISFVVLVGMWLERFIIVVVSLHRDFLTSSWGMYYPTRWDWMTYIGTIGLFLSAMFLFVRVLPMISIFEMRTLLPEAEVKE